MYELTRKQRGYVATILYDMLDNGTYLTNRGPCSIYANAVLNATNEPWLLDLAFMVRTMPSIKKARKTRYMRNAGRINIRTLRGA